MDKNRRLSIQSILTGLILALSFMLPGTWYSVGLGWVSAILFCHILNQSCGAYRFPYLAMVVAHATAIYWLIETINKFGNFPIWISALIFALFCLSNSLYILVASFIFRHLPLFFHRWLLAAPIGIAVAEFLSIRIFPWHFGSTQIKFIPFVQIADIGGAVLVSFVMLLVAGAIEKLLRERRVSVALAPAVIAFVSVVTYGQMRIEQFGTLGPKTHKISIIQGNIPIFDKHAPELFRANIAAYSALGSAYETSDNLIVWPETVIMTPVPADNLNKFSLSFLSKTPKWLVGAVTLGANNNVYNSAISLNENAAISGIYHKLILMPFGEYVPFSKTFPWLLDLAHMAGELTPGDGVKNLNYPATATTPELRVAPLICYEDVVTDLAREAVANGANLLVNMTNDAWFGDTVAPFQHNLLASFRAIENRRYLVRASNTGLSSVINPLGETTLYLQPFSEGVLSTVIEPLEVTTPYSAIFGNKLGWGLSIMGLLFSGIGFRKRKELVRCHEQK